MEYVDLYFPITSLKESSKDHLLHTHRGGIFKGQGINIINNIIITSIKSDLGAEGIW